MSDSRGKDLRKNDNTQESSLSKGGKEMSWKVPIPQDVYEWFGDDYMALNMFIHILLRARVSDMEKPSYYKGKAYQLKKGEVIFGRNQWAKFLNSSPTGTSKCLERVKKVTPIVTTKVTGKFTIISVQNYDEITGMVTTKVTPKVSPECHLSVTSETPECHLSVTTIERKKERKKERERNIIISPPKNYTANNFREMKQVPERAFDIIWDLWPIHRRGSRISCMQSFQSTLYDPTKDDYKEIKERLWAVSYYFKSFENNEQKQKYIKRLDKFFSDGDWSNYIGTLQENDFTVPMLQYLQDSEYEKKYRAKEVIS